MLCVDYRSTFYSLNMKALLYYLSCSKRLKSLQFEIDVLFNVVGYCQLVRELLPLVIMLIRIFENMTRNELILIML